MDTFVPILSSIYKNHEEQSPSFKHWARIKIFLPTYLRKLCNHT